MLIRRRRQRREADNGKEPHKAEERFKAELTGDRRLEAHELRAEEKPQELLSPITAPRFKEPSSLAIHQGPLVELEG